MNPHVFLNCVQLAFGEYAGHCRKTPLYFIGKRRVFRKSAVEGKICREVIELCCRIEIFCILDIILDIAGISSHPCLFIGRSVCQNILSDLLNSDSVSGAIGSLQRQNFAIDDDDSVRLRRRLHQNISLSSDLGEILKQVYLLLYKVQSLN